MCYKHLRPLGEWGNVMGANWYFSKHLVLVGVLEN